MRIKFLSRRVNNITDKEIGNLYSTMFVCFQGSDQTVCFRVSQLSNSFLKALLISWIMSVVVVERPCL